MPADDQSAPRSILKPGFEDLAGSPPDPATRPESPQRAQAGMAPEGPGPERSSIERAPVPAEPERSPIERSPIERSTMERRPSPSVPGLRTPSASSAPAEPMPFLPRRPTSFEEAGIKEESVEKLICRYLYPRGSATGRKLAQHFGLPFRLLEGLLRRMKNDMVLAYKRTAAVGDYEYVLTDVGYERGRRDVDMCAYCDAAPVPIGDYIASVKAQSLTTQRIRVDQLSSAFEDLLVGKRMLDRLGPALNSGRGMFLYGAPGNGKTSVAERITRCFGSHIWIPRAIEADGEIIRLFDPILHQEVVDGNESELGDSGADGRWVRIVRPTVMVGGELSMSQLELRHNPETNITEAPLQMKSNCGALVIDDFGRQRMPTAELLNRWIVPLEKRYDYLLLAGGKKLQVPFDQLIVFSTNLEPRDLVDEAFLRRIPYKIQFTDPSADEFREIFRRVAPSLGFDDNPALVDYLIRRHYVEAGRPMRACHPRDLLMQVRSSCQYLDQPPTLSEELLDVAVQNYFTVM
jgi:hypothetical protein